MERPAAELVIVDWAVSASHAVGAVIATAGAILGGILLVGDFFVLPDARPDVRGVPTWTNMIGLMLLVFIGPFAVGACFWLAQVFTRMVKSCGHSRVVLFLVVLAVSSAAGFVAAVLYLCNDHVQLGEDVPKGDPLKELIGIWIAVGTAAVAVVAATLAYQLRVHRKRMRSMNSSSPWGDPRSRPWSPGKGMMVNGDGGSETRPDDRPRRLCRRVGERRYPAMWQALRLLVLFIVFGLAAVGLGAAWDFSDRPSYPFSPSEECLTWEWSMQKNSPLAMHTLVFFLFLAVLVLFTALPNDTQCGRRLWHHRLFSCRGRRDVWADHTVSVGEGLGVVWFVAFLCTWTTVWSLDVHRDSTGRQGESTRATVARVSGHVGLLCLALTYIPLSLGSLWDHIFPVRVERAACYHGAVGLLAWLAASVHMSLWFIDWGERGVLRHNVIAIGNLNLADGAAHSANFTVVIAEIAWVLLTVLAFVAACARRRNAASNRFRWTHLLALPVLLGVWLHSWGYWYYSVAPVLLWLWSSVRKAVRRGSPVEVVSMEACHGETQIVVAPKPFRHRPGQLAWIHVPTVSEVEWHPAFISSAPSSSVMTFHLAGWTGSPWRYQLQQAANSWQWYPGHTRGDPPVVRLDGPYGHWPAWDTATAIILLAEDAGVAPLHALHSELLYRAKMKRHLGALRRVDFVWTVHDERMIYKFANTFRMQEDSALPRDMFHISLYATTDYDDADMDEEDLQEFGFIPHVHVSRVEPLLSPRTAHDGVTLPPFHNVSGQAVCRVALMINRGRPDVPVHLDGVHDAVRARSNCDVRPDEVLVIACGPSDSVQSAEYVCADRGFRFHGEVVESKE